MQVGFFVKKQIHCMPKVILPIARLSHRRCDTNLAADKECQKKSFTLFLVPKQAYGEHRVELLRPLGLEAVDIPYYVISSADELSKKVAYGTAKVFKI